MSSATTINGFNIRRWFARSATTSIVIGASDSRLLHPRALERVFGGRFANLALNAGRAYEQYRLATLFIEEVETGERFWSGSTMCGATWRQMIGAPRSACFPEWMYDGDWRNDLRYMLNL